MKIKINDPKIDVSKDIRKYDLTNAKHDTMHCLTPGLFRSLKKGDYKKHKLDITYILGNRKSIEIKIPEPLGAMDMRVLQGLVALAGPIGKRLSPEPKTEGGKELRRKLELKFDAVKDDAITVKSSYRKLAKEIGYADTNNTEIIRKCIERLWMASIFVQDGSKRIGCRLLSQYASENDKDGKLYVALNPLIAKSVMGGQHVHIEMAEVRALKSDPARLVHQRLCGWINPGQSKKIEINKVIEYIWPDETSNVNTLKKRNRTAKKALEELKSINWNVNEYAKDKWQIKRPGILSCQE